MYETKPSESKPGKPTSVRVAEVDALLSVFPEIGPVRACRRVGIPKETYYWHKRKQRGAAPSSDPEPRSGAVSVGTEGPQGTPDAEGRGNPEVEI
jgi:hypothetical protein